MQKRVIVLFSLFALGFGLLCVQMLTVMGSAAVQSRAQASTSISAVVGTTRGYIYDCNMRPLVNCDTQLVAAVKPSVEALNEAGSVLVSEDKDTLYETVTSGKIAVAAASAPLETDNVQTVSRYVRYGENAPAPHVIGYTNADGDGVSGVEKSYNELLKSASGTLWARCGADALGRVLDGAALEIDADNYNSPTGVVLTLQYDIQRIAEEALEKFEVKAGAVVVLDTATSEIRAMASVPTFDRNDPAASLDASDAPFLNRAVTPYAVGSVFKSITAAAALESGYTEDFSYTCTGSITIGGTTFGCLEHSGHGAQDMQEAMANSCNPYFVQLALHTGAEAVCSMGENLGLGAKIELSDGDYTKPGNMPAAYTLTSLQDLANLSFGQGELLASPLQMAAVYAAIANGGVYRAPSLMHAIVDAGGQVVQRAFLPTSRRAMSEETAERVGALLHYATENGSGRRAKPAGTTVAGKTATAQSGWYRDDGTEITHAWFCGYFPYESPRYSVAVLKEDGQGGSVDCAPIFRYIAEEIMKLS